MATDVTERGGGFHLCIIIFLSEKESPIADDRELCARVRETWDMGKFATQGHPHAPDNERQNTEPFGG